MNPYLADIKAIKKVAYTNQNVDDTMISSVLIRVQDSYSSDIRNYFLQKITNGYQ